MIAAEDDLSFIVSDTSSSNLRRATAIVVKGMLCCARSHTWHIVPGRHVHSTVSELMLQRPDLHKRLRVILTLTY